MSADTFNPGAVYTYTSQQLHDYAAEGHDIPADALLKAEQREANAKDEAEARAELDALNAQAEADAAAARDAARPTVDDLVAAHAEALDDYRPAAAAARDAIRERDRKWVAVTTAHRQLRDYVAEHFGTKQYENRGDYDPQIHVRYGQGVVVNGSMIHTAGTNPIED